MKKLLLTAVGAILGVTAASADPVAVKVGANIEGKTLTKATELVDGHHYLIWDNQADRTGYHYPAESKTDIRKDRTDKTAYSPEYVWTAEAVTGDDGETKWKLFNQGYQVYLTKFTHGGNTGISGDAAAVLTYTQTDGTFSLTDTTSGEMWNGNPDNLAGWSGAHPLFFYDLAENDAVENYYLVTTGAFEIGYHVDGTVFSSDIFDGNTTVSSTNTDLTVKDGLRVFKFTSARLSERWAATNANGVTTDLRGNAEIFVEVPGTEANTLKMFSPNKNAWLKAPANNANATALSANASEAALYTRTRSTTGAELFFSDGVGMNLRSNNVAGWTLSDIGSYWFQVYDEDEFDANIAYYTYENVPNTFSSTIADAKEIEAKGLADETVVNTPQLAALTAAIAAAEAARFGEAGLKAKIDGMAAYVKAVNDLLEVPEEEIAPVIAAGDYIFETLGLGNADDLAAWTAAKNLTYPVHPSGLDALKASIHTLLTSASQHMPEDGMYVNFRHPQKPVLMGIINGNLQRNGDENTTTFTLKPADGGFYIYNEYTNSYIQHPTATNVNAAMVTDKADATVYTLDLESLTPLEEHTELNFGLKATDAATRNYLHSNNANNNTANVVSWYQGSSSSWFIERSTAEIAANEYLLGTKAHYNAMTFSENVGEYSVTEASKAAAEVALGVGTDASIVDKRAAGLTLNSVETSLNMPKVGHVYMFSKIDRSMYMSCDTVSDHRATMVAPTDTNLLSRLFYLNENHNLVSLKNGKVMGRFLSTDNRDDVNNSWRTVLLSNTNKVGEFTFAEAPERGKYTVAAQGGRYLYNANADVDCGTNANNNGYYWTIEDKGEWIPVAGTNTDYATICLPYAVQTRSGMTVYTAKVNNGKIVRVPFEGSVIPANTPVMVDFNGVQRDGASGLVFLDRYYGNEIPEVEGNELQGSVYAFTPEQPVALRNGFRTFALNTAAIVDGGHAFVNGDLHTVSTLDIESELDALEGKVFTIKNTDVANNRGYLIYSANTDALWTSGKGGAFANDAADAAAPTDVNFHWTLVKHDGKRYLYNLGAKKFVGAYVPKGGNGGKAEFVWHFSDCPTAIDFVFYDYDFAETIADATFNIFGGEKVGVTDNTRPAGMMIINGNSTHPVPAVAGNSANDGCGFKISIVEGATVSEVASAQEALAAMEAEHSAAVNYVANYDETLPAAPGHYDVEGYGIFATAMEAEAADAQAKYYVLTRARQAAKDHICQFEDGKIYNLYNAEGQLLMPQITWIDGKYLLSTGIAAEAEAQTEGEEEEEDDSAHAANWLCSVDAEGNVQFTHGFTVPVNSMPYEPVAETPAAVRARFIDASKLKEVSHSFAETAAPATYDGMGNITLGTQSLGSSAALPDDAKSTTTEISEISADVNANGAVYDLQGRRVRANAKGLLIVNGRKVVVK